MLQGLCIALVVLPLSACAPWSASPQDAVASARNVMSDNWHYDPSLPGDQTHSATTDLAQWWAQFGDTTLTGLIEQALLSNNALAAAEGRLRTARATYDASRGARLPGVSAGGSGSRQKAVEGTALTTETYNLGLDASWELDIFGKLRGASEATARLLDGSQANLYDVQRLITSDIALNYITLRDAQARLAIARDNLAIQQENLQLVNWRNQAGLGNQLEVEQARTAVAQTRASLAPLEQTVATAINQIDVLLGQQPGSSAPSLSLPAPLPAPPAITSLGLPAQLLERRPDVLSAQRTLEAEIIRIGVAQADLYPALRLSGALNTSSDTVGNLFETSVASLIGNISAPIFQGGQIRARIEQQKGSADSALANYRSAILIALQDVDNALLSAETARQREAALQDAEASALLSLQLAEIRYRSGAIDFQTLLDVQRNLLSIQDSRASASAARSTSAVQLFKALGGGWNAAQLP